MSTLILYNGEISCYNFCNKTDSAKLRKVLVYQFGASDMCHMLDGHHYFLQFYWIPKHTVTSQLAVLYLLTIVKLYLYLSADYFIDYVYKMGYLIGQIDMTSLFGLYELWHLTIIMLMSWCIRWSFWLGHSMPSHMTTTSKGCGWVGLVFRPILIRTPFIIILDHIQSSCIWCGWLRSSFMQKMCLFYTL